MDPSFPSRSMQFSSLLQFFGTGKIPPPGDPIEVDQKPLELSRRCIISSISPGRLRFIR